MAEDNSIAKSDDEVVGSNSAEKNFWHNQRECSLRVALALEAISTNSKHTDDKLQKIADALEENKKSLQSIAASATTDSETFSKMLSQLILIQQSLPPALPTGFLVDELAAQLKGENKMQKVTGHKVKIDILPNGTVKFTFTPIPDGSVLPAGTPALTYTSSDPSLVVTADPADTSGFGLSAIGTPNLPADSTGVQGITVTGSTTLPGASAPIQGVSDPVNIVPAPNLPTGFAVTEA